MARRLVFRRPRRPRTGLDRFSPAQFGPAYATAGHVTLQSQEAQLRVTALLGDEPPKITDGYGGWEEIARPGRLPLTVWQGQPPYRMEISLVLDGYADDRSVEPQIAMLEQMGRDPGGDNPPPVITVGLPGGEPRSPAVKWVVEKIDWGDELRADAGHRLRAHATVALVQHVPDQRLARIRRKRRKRPKTYTVKKGDTLMTIANRILGSPKRWREIARLNNIRDPRRLKVGQKLKLP